MKIFRKRWPRTVLVATGVVLLMSLSSVTGVFASSEEARPPVAQNSHGIGDIDGYAQQLQEIAIPLESREDLDALVDQVGDRRLVLLGESTHGTREFYEWRAAITQRLIEEKNFSFIAVEGDWSAFVPLDRYVRGEPGAPGSVVEALAGFERWPQWMWANPEIASLAEWLREYNDGREDGQKVGIYGMDIYGAADSLEKAPRHMKKIDAERAGEMKAAFECFAPFVGDPRRYFYALTVQGVNCAEGIAVVLDDLEENRDAYARKNRKAFLHAKQNAAVVYRTEKHYRSMARQDASSWNARARNFYETIERLRSYYGEGAGGVVWAHNTHVGDARAMQAGQGFENLGMHARKALGRENVFVAGFGTHRGTVTAARSWEGSMEIMTVPEALTGSLEDVMHRVDTPGAAVLFLSRDAEAIGVAHRHIGHRAIGVTYNPEREIGNYVPTIWPERYDAFLFIEETRWLEPLSME